MENAAQEIIVMSPPVPGILGALIQTLLAIIILGNFTLAASKDKNYYIMMFQFLFLLTLPFTMHDALSSYVIEGGEVSPTLITEFINLRIYPYIVLFVYLCISGTILYMKIDQSKAKTESQQTTNKKG